MSEWLTCAQVADELGVSTRTVLRWVERGDLRAVKLPGGRLRIAQSELAATLEAWSTGTGPERMLAVVGDQEGHDADG